MNDLPKRTLTAILFGAIMIAGFIFNPWVFLILVVIINFGCTLEFCRLATQIFKKPASIEAPVAATISSLFLCFTGIQAYTHFSGPVFSFATVVLVFFMEAIVCFLWKKGKEIYSAFIFATAWLYITLPLFLFLAMVSLQGGNWFPERVGYAFSILLIIWMNDTAAYFTGRKFGTHIISEISPRKTWEGFAGGLAGSMLAGILLSVFMLNVCPWLGMAFGVVICIFGTIGDFFESGLKRQAEVKDSGNLLPGHGGLLDRFDAFLFAIPFAYLFIIYVF